MEGYRKNKYKFSHVCTARINGKILQVQILHHFLQKGIMMYKVFYNSGESKEVFYIKESEILEE